MTAREAREAFEAASEAWTGMESIASERAADYELLRSDANADPVEVVRARLQWGVAHVSAAVLWVARAEARDRMNRLNLEAVV